MVRLTSITGRLRPLAGLAFLAVMAGVAVSTAGAARGDTSSPVLGAVPVRGATPSSRVAGSPNPAQISPQASSTFLQTTTFGDPGAGNLAYHGGPVMKTNKVYAIYWLPAGASASPSYQPLIDGFLRNVVAADGAADNVYSVDRQYYDTGGWITMGSSYGASVVDTNPFPVSGCSDPYTSVCLTDTQIRSEIQKVSSSKSWKPSPTTLFFMFTPRDVGTCTSYGSCSYTDFCAYHSFYGSGSSVLLYANMPYASWVPRACDTGQHPNGDDADATINVASHEGREAITDPLGNGWYDTDGEESSDKCAWNFGPSPGPDGAKYNQTINSVNYYIQQEWSNDNAGCALGYVKPTYGVPTITGFSPATGLAGQPVTITGTNFAGVTSILIGKTVIPTANIDSTTQITATLPSNALTGKLAVTTLAKSTAYSPTSFGVLPRIDSFSVSSGIVGSTFVVYGNTFTGTTKVTIGGVAARYSVASITQLKVTVPRGALTGPVAITNAGGTATSSDVFTVL